MFRTAAVVDQGASDTEALARQVGEQIREVLGADDCRFELLSGSRAEPPVRLRSDGSVSEYGEPVDVLRHGMPTDGVITLDACDAGVPYGRFLISVPTRVVRPSAEARHVAVLLADQVGVALARASA